MLFFPQLSTGGSTLYPAKRTLAKRTVVNSLMDGREVVYADPDGAADGWDLQLDGLTLVEATAIESLFAQTAGMFGAFTFLDPVGNLLAGSEQLASPFWTLSGLVSSTAGVADPFGTTRGNHVVNSGVAAGGLTQVLTVPANFHYCLSIWARGSGTLTLSFSAGAAESSSWTLQSGWNRYSVAGNLRSSATAVTFGVSLSAGASADLFGAQAEAQLASSDYKKTGTRGGVYPKARFASDELRITARATDQYDARIRIVNTEQ
jgi:hypothetical protein